VIRVSLPSPMAYKTSAHRDPEGALDTDGCLLWNFNYGRSKRHAA